MPSLKFKCDYCDGRFRSATKLSNHLTETELKAHPDKTDEINRMLNKLSLRTNSVPNEVVCQQCNRKYGNKYRLKNHIDMVHGSHEPEPEPEHESEPEPEPVPEPEPKTMTASPNYFDYLKGIEYLEARLGHEETYNFIKGRCYRPVKGEIEIIDKIFLSSDNPEDYPIRCVSLKPIRVEYLDQNQYWIDDKDLFINKLRSIVQDCYIVYNNLNIANCIKPTPSDFYDSDIFYWQSRISESLKPAYQERLYNEMGRHANYKVPREKARIRWGLPPGVSVLDYTRYMNSLKEAKALQEAEASQEAKVSQEARVSQKESVSQEVKVSKETKLVSDHPKSMPNQIKLMPNQPKSTLDQIKLMPSQTKSVVAQKIKIV